MGLLGRKVGMTQAFDQKGEWAALSVVEVGPCVVVDKKTEARDGYTAVVLGFGEKAPRRTNKPQTGQFAKANTTPKRWLREVRLSAAETEQFEVGQTLTVDQVFDSGDFIDVTGTSKGKGFQGVMKRYNFSGFRATHGTHEYFRHGGSIGCRLTPGRTVKGKKMPGQMGNKRVTTQNLKVREVVGNRNLLLIPGSVPGAPDGLLVVKHAAKRPDVPFALRTPTAADAPADAAAEA
ncbi:MAG: 50S ribosomal protein L3 [Myxococcales bacterium]|nr:50S ribosomal protein L3 [Myxococcales bacterium]